MQLQEKSAPAPTGHARLAALDGIRTVAVFAVIAFHVELPGAGGGFAGVDLFFVLSGFLITGLLLTDVDKYGRVRLATFWNRRFRRLMPAFLVMIVAVMVWSATQALPVLRPGLRSDAIWSLIYLGNWHFIGTASYFESSGATSPLQHVWSLAVEEQFYVAWPLIVLIVGLLVARKRSAAAHRLTPGNVGLIAVLLAVVSAVLLAVLFDPTAPERAYMGTDTRAFEPLLGAALACAMRSGRVRALAARWSLPLSVTGLLGVVAGLLWLGERGVGAVPAYYFGGAAAFTLACVALIAGVFAGPGTVPATVLSWAPIAWLGRISYGIYLWHWPLRVWIIPEDGNFYLKRSLLVAGLSVVLAALSYYLVEKPVREGRLTAWLTPPRTLTVAVGLIAALLAGSVVIKIPHNPDGHRLLLIGDSVPKRLAPMAARFALNDPTFDTWLIGDGSVGSCPGMPVSPRNPDGTTPNNSNCPRQVKAAQDAAIDALEPDVIVWWSRAELYDRFTDDGKRVMVGTDAFWEMQRADLVRAVTDLRDRTGATVVLVETDRPGLGLDTRCTPQYCHYFLKRLKTESLRLGWIKVQHEAAEMVPGVKVIKIDDAFCKDDKSPCDDRLASGKTARPDGTHFSAEAGPIVSKALLTRVAEVLG